MNRPTCFAANHPVNSNTFENTITRMQQDHSLSMMIGSSVIFCVSLVFVYFVAVSVSPRNTAFRRKADKQSSFWTIKTVLIAVDCLFVLLSLLIPATR